jgi:hypothetical protein
MCGFGEKIEMLKAVLKRYVFEKKFRHRWFLLKSSEHCRTVSGRWPRIV